VVNTFIFNITLCFMS